MDKIDTFLQSEGILPTTDPHRFWRWAEGQLGRQGAKQFQEDINRRSHLDNEDSIRFYDSIGKPRQALVASSFEYGLLQQIGRWIEPQLPQEGTVLELGCGPGLLTRFYALARPNVRFVGIDVSEEAIETARRNAQGKAYGNVSFLVHDLRELEELPSIQADCIISGRVFSELMTRVRRRRSSWDELNFPPPTPDLDLFARQALLTCAMLASPGGKFLVTERLTDFDRLNRLWCLIGAAGFLPDRNSMLPISWKDVSGSHQTWFFSAKALDSVGSSRTSADVQPLQPSDLPMLTREIEATGSPTRILLDGTLAWYAWQALKIEEKLEEGLYLWPAGEEIHFELGLAKDGLGYSFIASNTDILMLSIFLQSEFEAVRRDLREYLQQLGRSGGILV